MKTFKQFSEELSRGGGNGSLTIFDIDDTLFHTTARIVVKDDSSGEFVERLTGSEYNTHRLKSGHSYNYGEFRDAAKFYKESRPISGMIAKAKAIVKNLIKNPDSKVIIVTARANFDDKDKFLATFKRHGFPIDQTYVERAGNMNDILVPAVKKAIILRKYLNSGRFKKVSIFDDSESILKEFLRVSGKYPDIEFHAWLVNPVTGRVKKKK